MRKYIYKLERTDKVNYDEYISCIVVANDEEHARIIHPDWSFMTGDPSEDRKRFDRDWAYSQSNITCQKIGTADKSMEVWVVDSNFIAGQSMLWPDNGNCHQWSPRRGHL